MRRALVTNARIPHALTMIRALAGRGYAVTAADSARLAPGLWSRHAAVRKICPPPGDAPEAYCAWLRREVANGGYDLLVPTFEDVFALSAMRDELSTHAGLAVMDIGAMRAVHHKARLARIVESAGLHTPATHQPADDEGLARVAESIRYPAVVKLPDGNNALGLSVARGRDELIFAHRRLVNTFALSGERRPIVQEHIDGDPLYILLIADEGETLGRVTYRPVRMVPDEGGTAFERESADAPDAEAAAMALAAHLRWTGFLSIDVLRDRATGACFIIDANPRPTPALQTGLAAGVDFVALYERIATGARAIDAAPVSLSPLAADGEDLAHIPHARAGVRTKTLFVAIIWAMLMLRPGRGFFARLARVFASRPRAIPDVHRWSDPLPSLAMTLFVPWFIAITVRRGERRGGFCFGLNVTWETLGRIAECGMRSAE
ncbi:ATP-grasp domain-containing protein [bacterium]|nr:ATP-grasp domain-containing protein [bacterium]